MLPHPSAQQLQLHEIQVKFKPFPGGIERLHTHTWNCVLHDCFDQYLIVPSHAPHARSHARTHARTHARILFKCRLTNFTSQISLRHTRPSPLHDVGPRFSLSNHPEVPLSELWMHVRPGSSRHWLRLLARSLSALLLCYQKNRTNEVIIVVTKPCMYVYHAEFGMDNLTGTQRPE